MSKIKICGLYRFEDISYVNETMPDYAGFIINFKKSHRSIDLNTAKTLIAKLDKNITSVCVFVNEPISYIENFKDICDVIQLHGDETNDYIHQLRQKTPKTIIWKAFKIKNESDLIKAKNCNADMVLLDNGYGTGEVFDWGIITDFDRPFILAGGITTQNALSAIKKFAPFALDVSSGVEENKIKNLEKIKQIINIVRSEK